MRNAKRGIVLGALLLGAAGPAYGWGTAGHEAIVRLAVERTSDRCLKGFFYSYLSTIVTEAMAPDRWKGFDSDEPPRHYLNLDVESDFSQYPRRFDDVVMKYGAARAIQQGLVPWRTAEFVEKLKMRFAARDVAGATAVAGQLGHYVGDAHSPLHATLNFDGQRTGDTGLHERWEVAMPRDYGRSIESRAQELAATLSEPDPDPVPRIFEALATGALLVPAIVEVDLRTRGTPTALFDAQGEMASLRWAQAAALLSSLWRSAHEAAGKPLLSGMPASCFPRPDAGVVMNPAPSADAGPIEITGGTDDPRHVSGGGGCSALGDGCVASFALCAAALAVLTAALIRRRRAPR